MEVMWMCDKGKFMKWEYVVVMKINTISKLHIYFIVDNYDL